MRFVPAGIVVLPLALLAGGVALVATATAAAAPEAGRVELELAGVLPMPEGRAGVVVLREKGKDTLLPIIVPDGRDFPSGRRGRLLGSAIEALGARVFEVELDRAEESSAAARVRLAQEGRAVEVRAVASESIALAIAAGVPIVTSRRVLDEAGLTSEELARSRQDDAPLRL